MRVLTPAKLGVAVAVAAVLILCLLFLLRQGSDASTEGPVGESATGNNAFAVRLFQQLTQSPGNTVISPLSIRTALAISFAGARGDTADQMAKALYLEDGAGNSYVECGGLSKGVSERNAPGCEILSANALFIHSGFPVKADFEKVARKSFSAKVNELDFANSGAARSEINQWVAKRTQNQISGILPPTLPNPATPLIIVNAIWFKGKWMTRFDPASTQLQPFNLASGGSVSVPMMHLIGHFRYAKMETFQILELPYLSKHFSMIILLPRSPDGLPAIEKELNPMEILHLLQAAQDEEVQIALPKFKEKCHFELDNALKAMGMTKAFSEGADLSGTTARQPFFIYTVLHDAYLEVDEEGTRAAAATGVVETLGMPLRFKADHPFLFWIQDNQTGAILFLGRVADPTKG